MMGNALWIWKEPVIGHKYVMGVDVSRGDSEDFSSFQIIDFDKENKLPSTLENYLLILWPKFVISGRICIIVLL
jgi:hypothetical protein